MFVNPREGPGFLIIKAGDTFSSGRYHVFRKLGVGQFSSVWLAEDLTAAPARRYVAIKIGTSWMYAENMRELELWRVLNNSLLTAEHHPGRVHVPILLDSFVVDINDIGAVDAGERRVLQQHVCFVFEPLGRQIEAVQDDFDPDQKESSNWPHAFFQRASKQLLLALDYLHANRLMHRDVQLGNVLLALNHDINSYSIAEIEQKTNKGNELNDRNDAFPLHDNVVPLASPPFLIQLTDLTAACPFAFPSATQPAYPLALRAPEVILSSPAQPITPAADVWALGCAIFKLITGRPLFVVEDFGGEDRADLDRQLLLSFVEVLGPMSPAVRHHWKAADEYLDVEGGLRVEWPEDERDLPLGDAVRDGWPSVAGGWKNGDAREEDGETERELFVGFMEAVLKWIPEERPSTEELLLHPWMVGIQY